MTGISLAGKVIVVTGAARGLGRAYAARLAARGARVVVNDVAGVADVVEQLRLAGATAFGCAGSVADPDTAETLVGTCLREFGRIDGLVNNAGVRPEGWSWEEDPEITRRTVEVNLLGTLHCGAAALKAMVRQGSGSIVNVSSRAQAGIPRSATYAATKGAVASLTYSWALDVPPGVRVNAIAPQARGTGTRRPGTVFRPEEPEPEAIAPLVTYLLSDAAARVNGQVVRLIGRPAGMALGVVKHPRGARVLTDPGGWTEEAIAAAFAGDLGPDLEPVGAATG
ncbi:SDR family NAD(P)-dependent oxidoreductase [Amycolatopsis acidicola]|uniref:SDR family NAD(P)-dependent oxidoreductase n=1 Tax=Amycolatopsis acidicola TaxID=2596893 RepID=A0A5N0V0T3_9PSEU|nr:SDR family NAD(P)-dependent oxidoreductase [Amycolatopsis acidicola]KAA9160079.1 SDR family NAD(P)-dependent oxidoreductase [Amycolatopsis acidicola]